MRRLAFVTAIAFISLTSFGCGQRPRVDISPTVENEQVVFNVSYRDINGILGFRVEDADGAVLWKIDLGYYKGHKIVYGVVPKGDKQLFPANDKPPASIRGKKVRVIVKVQYDDWAPSARDFAMDLQIP